MPSTPQPGKISAISDSLNRKVRLQSRCEVITPFNTKRRVALGLAK